MGTKRVGWARIRSLINENQNQIKIRNNKLRALTADTTLTAADSGDIFTLVTAVDVTLPAPGTGLRYRFLVKENTPATACTVVATSTLCFGSCLADTNGTLSLVANGTPGTGFTTATIHADTEQGAWLEYTSDGTNWYVHGSGTTASGNVWVAYT